MTPVPMDRHGETGDSLSVATVAALVGVAPSTLRTWARRYGLEPSHHRSGLHRRYSEVDVARLRLMRSLTRSGMSSREAASRAAAASLDELAVAPAGAAAGAPRPARGWDPTYAERLDPAVRTLLATAGRGDAQGATTLLRRGLRDVGAARTFDERFVPARGAAWLLHPAAKPRAEAVLSTAAVEAVGEVTLRRSARNRVTVLVTSVPGHEDPAAVALLRAALAERSLSSAELAPGAEPDAADVVVAVFAADAAIEDGSADRVRDGARAPLVLFGQGWAHRPGEVASLADVVRGIEGAVAQDSPAAR